MSVIDPETPYTPMIEMRVLTVRQPWAWAIVFGGKDVENRTRNLAGAYRGPVAIHVGLRDDDTVDDYEHPMHGLVYGECPHAEYARHGGFDHNAYHCEWCRHTAPRRHANHGFIIGVVHLVGVHQSHYTAGGALLDMHASTCAGQPCSVWAESEAHHLELSAPHALTNPIPYTGGLGLRRLAPGVTRRIREEMT